MRRLPSHLSVPHAPGLQPEELALAEKRLADGTALLNSSGACPPGLKRAPALPPHALTLLPGAVDFDVVIELLGLALQVLCVSTAEATRGGRRETERPRTAFPVHLALLTR